MSDPRPFLVGGEWRTSDDVLEVRFPYTNEVIGRVYQASDRDLEDAILAAERGFALTRKLPSHARSRILLNLAEQMERRRDDLVETLILEGGKARKVAAGEVSRAVETVRVSAEEAKRIHGEIITIDWTEAGEGRQGFVRRVPLGPVLGIAPFNYPLNLACHKLAPAIAAGNSFILKPASATPLSALLLAEMTLDAGFPPEALSVVVCRGAKAEKLVADPRIQYFTFTGSSEVGWHLKTLAGRKRVGLELGGNAAAIVHEDANLDYAARLIAAGGFANAGQNCIAVQRVLLHRPIYNQALELLLDRVSQLVTGDPRDPATDVGPMIEQARGRRDGEGERASAGAQRCSAGRLRRMIAPTVLGDLHAPQASTRGDFARSDVAPTATSTGDPAANDTDYGLQTGLFRRTSIVSSGVRRDRGRRLQINDVSTFRGIRAVWRREGVRRGARRAAYVNEEKPR